MIKFFRRIRQKLISENRFSTYLLYAIGEIVLVVIGILIALQINNASEERKTSQQLNGYLSNIRKNIESDTLKINTIKRLRIEHNKAAEDYMKSIMKDSMPIDLISKFVRILGEQYLTLDQSGFEALKSSGYISNLQGSELEDAILNYYASYQQIHESEVSLNNFIESLEAGLYADNFEDLLIVFKVLNRNDFAMKTSQKDQEVAVKNMYRNAKILGIMQRVSEENYFFVYDSLKIKGQEIVKLISKRRDH